MAVRDILIVEDQALARMYLCSCVEKCADCRVAGTLNRADAALRRCGDSHIDLILMDICTENNSSGLAYSKIIKEKFPSVKIILMTGVPDLTFIDKAKANNVDSFIYKNISSNSLITTIQNTIDGYSLYPNSKIGRASCRERV